MRRTKSFKQHLYERLQRTEEIADYVNAAIEENDVPTFLMALRDVADAKGLGKVAAEAKLNRENVYRMLSDQGNPRLNSLFSVLFVLGLKISVEAVDRLQTVEPLATVETKLLGGTSDPEQFQPTSGQSERINYECTVPANDEPLAA